VEHDDRVDVAPLAFVRYARDAEPTPEPGVHGRARERARLPRRGQGGIGVVSPAPATVYAVRRVPAPAPAVAPAAPAAAAAAAPRSRHPPSRHEASTFGEARLQVPGSEALRVSESPTFLSNPRPGESRVGAIRGRDDHAGAKTIDVKYLT
jgi:hypothetical protein